MGTVGPAQTLTWPNCHVYLPPNSTGAKARLVSVVVTLIVYLGIPQMQDLPNQSWGFNPRLVQLQGKIPLPLPQSHCPWSSALVLAPPLCGHYPQASVPCPGERERKQWLIGAYLFPQAREGYGSHSWGVCKLPAAAGTGRQLQQTGLCLLWWECRYIL